VPSVRPSAVKARAQEVAAAGPEVAEPTPPATPTAPSAVPEQAQAPAEPQIVASPPVRPTVITRKAPAPPKPSQVKAVATPPEAVTESSEAGIQTGAPVTIELVTANWPRILQDITASRKVAGLVMIGTQPLSLSADGMLAVGFPNDGACKNFSGSPTVALLQDSIKKFIGANLRIDAFVDSSLNQKSAPKAEVNVEESEADSDAVVGSASAVDMITSMLGGQVIIEHPTDS